MMEETNEQFISVDEILKSLLSREGDIFGVNRLRYLEVSKDVFIDLNLTAVKRTKSVILTVDHHRRCIVLPSDYFKFSTIDAVLPSGYFEPLVINSSIKDKDIVDVALAKDCDCECGCVGVMVPHNKHYEYVSEEVLADMPDGSKKIFTKTVRKYIKKDGAAYVEIVEPTAIYVNGEHDSTQLVTKSVYLCKMEVKPCGCVVDTVENRKLWGLHGSSYIHGVPFEHEWCFPSIDRFPQSATYNFSEDGLRLIVPPNFAYNKVKLRYYVLSSTKDIRVPRIAKKAFMMGIKKEIADFDDSPIYNEKNINAKYIREKDKLRNLLSMCQINEFYEYWFGRNTHPGYSGNQRSIYWNSNNI